jgi:hypothetical protein
MQWIKISSGAFQWSSFLTQKVTQKGIFTTCIVNNQGGAQSIENRRFGKPAI